MRALTGTAVTITAAAFFLVMSLAWAPAQAQAQELEQVGAYSSIKNAQKAARQIEKEGKKAIISESVTASGKSIYRVYIEISDKDKAARKKAAKEKAAKEKAPRKKAAKEKAPAEAEPGEAAEKERMKLRVIFVRTIEDADEILDEIEGGKRFAMLAKQRSLDEQTRNAYGYLGDVEVAKLDKLMKKAVLGLKAGETSDVVRLEKDLFALIQIVDMSHYEKGEKDFRSGKFEDAEKSLRKHVELNPDAFKSYIMLGKIYEVQQRLEDAVAMFKTALEFKPDREEPYAWLGRLYLKMKRYREAKEVFDEGIRRNPYSKRLQEGIELADLLMMSDEH